MDDEQSTNEVVETPDAPAEDTILQALEATEDTEQSEVVETPEAEEPDAETPPEGEQSEEESEEIEPDDDPKEEARRRYEERQRARSDSRQRIIDQNSEYVQDAEDEYDQRLRSMEVQQLTQTVEATQNALIGEFERAKANPDLQMFNPDNKSEFNEKVYEKALRDYNAGYINYDQGGNIVGLKHSLYEHLTETANLFQGAVKSGAVQQVRATQRMRSNADTKPAASPKEAQRDTILDILSSD